MVQVTPEFRHVAEPGQGKADRALIAIGAAEFKRFAEERHHSLAVVSLQGDVSQHFERIGNRIRVAKLTCRRQRLFRQGRRLIQVAAIQCHRAQHLQRVADALEVTGGPEPYETFGRELMGKLKIALVKGDLGCGQE